MPTNTNYQNVQIEPIELLSAKTILEYVYGKETAVSDKRKEEYLNKKEIAKDLNEALEEIGKNNVTYVKKNAKVAEVVEGVQKDALGQNKEPLEQLKKNMDLSRSCLDPKFIKSLDPDAKLLIDQVMLSRADITSRRVNIYNIEDDKKFVEQVPKYKMIFATCDNMLQYIRENPRAILNYKGVEKCTLAEAEEVRKEIINQLLEVQKQKEYFELRQKLIQNPYYALLNNDDTKKLSVNRLKLNAFLFEKMGKPQLSEYMKTVAGLREFDELKKANYAQEDDNRTRNASGKLSGSVVTTVRNEVVKNKSIASGVFLGYSDFSDKPLPDATVADIDDYDPWKDKHEEIKPDEDFDDGKDKDGNGAWKGKALNALDLYISGSREANRYRKKIKAVTDSKFMKINYTANAQAEVKTNNRTCAGQVGGGLFLASNKFAPHITAMGGLEYNAVVGEASGEVATKRKVFFNTFPVLAAKATAKGQLLQATSFGLFQFGRFFNKKQEAVLGVNIMLRGGFFAARGTVNGGISACGLGIKGKASIGVGLGGNAKFKLVNGKFHVGLGFFLGVGFSLEWTIDFSAYSKLVHKFCSSLGKFIKSKFKKRCKVPSVEKKIATPVKTALLVNNNQLNNMLLTGEIQAKFKEIYYPEQSANTNVPVYKSVAFQEQMKTTFERWKLNVLRALEGNEAKGNEARRNEAKRVAYRRLLSGDSYAAFKKAFLSDMENNSDIEQPLMEPEGFSESREKEIKAFYEEEMSKLRSTLGKKISVSSYLDSEKTAIENEKISDVESLDTDIKTNADIKADKDEADVEVVKTVSDIKKML